MKIDDLKRSLDSIAPDAELKAKILALPGRASRPRLENPLMHFGALGAACLLCAGIFAAVMMLGGNPGGPASQPGVASGTGVETASPTDSAVATAEPETAPPSEQTPTPTADTAAPDPTAEQTPDPTAEAPTPAPTPTPNQDTAQITSAPEATALSSQGEVAGASGKGKIALGNSCDYIQAVVNDAGTFYMIKGQTTEEFLEYTDRYFKASRNNPRKHELDPAVHPGLIFVLIDGLVDESFVGTTISEDRLSLLISANDDAKSYGVYVQGMLGSATVEFSNDYETFVLTIRNSNPSFRPTSNFTILTRCAPDGAGDKVKYYTLPVSGK